MCCAPGGAQGPVQDADIDFDVDSVGIRFQLVGCVIENGSLENGEYIDHSSDIFDIIVLTTGIDAHTCVPWSGMMVKRITSCSRRIQHTLPSEDNDAVSSDLVSSDPLF